MPTRRSFLAQVSGFVAFGATGRLWPALTHARTAPLLTVYKSESCMCCAKWVEHVRGSGFKVVVHDVDPVDPVKDRLGVPRAMRSCHTAQVGDYIIEGHVPAPDIQRLLAEHPKVMGLAVPDMPKGTPGMDGPGMAKEPYEVLAFQSSGESKVYAKH